MGDMALLYGLGRLNSGKVQVAGTLTQSSKQNKRLIFNISTPFKGHFRLSAGKLRACNSKVFTFFMRVGRGAFSFAVSAVFWGFLRGFGGLR
ncbi:hypothetical protein ACUY2A_10825 [Corynebacterium pilbarense]